MHPSYSHLPSEVAGGCLAPGSFLELSSTDTSSALQVLGTHPESPLAADLNHLNKQVSPAFLNNTWGAVTNPAMTLVCALAPRRAAVGKGKDHGSAKIFLP